MNSFILTLPVWAASSIFPGRACWRKYHMNKILILFLTIVLASPAAAGELQPASQGLAAIGGSSPVDFTIASAKQDGTYAKDAVRAQEERLGQDLELQPS
jgi:hypothetical protein